LASELLLFPAIRGVRAPGFPPSRKAPAGALAVPIYAVSHGRAGNGKFASYKFNCGKTISSSYCFVTLFL